MYRTLVVLPDGDKWPLTPCALEPRLELALAEAEHVRAEPVAGELAGAPAAKDRLWAQAQERRNLARREQAVGHRGARLVRTASSDAP
jgi:hypothetical protein